MLIDMLEFARLRDLIYRRSGIFIGDDKDYFLESRALSRMEALDMDRFADYFRYVAFEAPEEEFKYLINCVTVNETFFFRDYAQFSAFGEVALPIITADRAHLGDRTIRVLSAGCSSGEEAYTLAIILSEMLEGESAEYVIDAVDINTEILDQARRGIYGPRATRDVPISYRIKYFEDLGDTLRVRSELRDRVQIEYGNLYDPQYMARFRDYDVVFCRNVLIYFDDNSRDRVLSSLYNLMRPGGFIFLGYSESPSRYSGAFASRCICPQVPEEQGSWAEIARRGTVTRSCSTPWSRNSVRTTGCPSSRAARWSSA